MSITYSPCKDCPERFRACSDNCPKDARGEYGYKAWKAEYRKVKDAEKEYKMRNREDWLRSEQCERNVRQYVESKNRMRGVSINGKK